MLGSFQASDWSDLFATLYCYTVFTPLSDKRLALRCMKSRECSVVSFALLPMCSAPRSFITYFSYPRQLPAALNSGIFALSVEEHARTFRLEQQISRCSKNRRLLEYTSP